MHLVESGHYAEVVMGMSRGLKEADPALRVLPGVIYPFEKSLKSLNRSGDRGVCVVGLSCDSMSGALLDIKLLLAEG